MKYLLLAGLAVMPASTAGATVASAVPHGFEIVETATVAATPAQAYAALAQVGGWWDGAHSYSGDAANLRLDPRPGGCFCERMPDGGAVEHLRVVQARPGRLLRLQGGLGPLQEEGVAGTLTWSIRPTPAGTEITQRYIVGGYVRSGAEKLAPMVDQVMTGQLARLRRFIETGSPGAAETR